jgi:hypothetical protein
MNTVYFRWSITEMKNFFVIGRPSLGPDEAAAEPPRSSLYTLGGAGAAAASASGIGATWRTEPLK